LLGAKRLFHHSDLTINRILLGIFLLLLLFTCLNELGDGLLLSWGWGWNPKEVSARVLVIQKAKKINKK